MTNTKIVANSGKPKRRRKVAVAKTIAKSQAEAPVDVIVVDDSFKTPVLINEDGTQQLAYNLEEFIPKEKLRNESLQERLNWWYKDLDSPTKRLIAQVASLALVALVIWGMREGVLKVGSVIEGVEVVSSAIAMVLMLLGIQQQTQYLRMPIKKIAVKTTDTN